MKKVILIGNHPIRENIVMQYNALCDEIETYSDFTSVPNMTTFGQLCVLPEKDIADNDTLQGLEAFAKSHPETPKKQSKPLCHLLLHDKMTLWLLQTLNIYEEIHRKFELYAFTLEDLWAKNAFCGLGKTGYAYPPLDREKIDTMSDKTVHLVIAGFSDLGESLATHAALTAHFPNSVQNSSLRTRITVIDEDLSSKKDAFIQRYSCLFDQSYYRIIDLKQRCITQYHEPFYHSTREDFVDVEWEFVNGNFYDPIIQQKLQLWGNSNHQLLTIALCDTDCAINFSRAFALPSCVYQNGITVFVHAHQNILLDKVRENENYRNLYPIGMDDRGYDVSLPLLQMAKCLNYCHAYSFGQKGIPTFLPHDEVEMEWRKVPLFSLRYSSIFNVMTIPTKMRSIGHEEKDWDKYYALTQEEIEILSAVEHNRWSVERLILGFRPPTDTERDEIRQNIEAFIAANKAGKEPPKDYLKKHYEKRKVHYDLCAYRELQADKTGQNVRIYDYDLTACIPLIAQSFNETRP